MGAYNATNVLAALCIGRYFGVDIREAEAAVEAYTPSNNRSQMTRTENNTLIIDAYNANPSSMAAALDNFSSIKADRKVALLGDMRELGEDSLKEHIGIVEKITGMGIEACLVGEEFSKALKVTGHEDIRWFATSEELCAYLEDNPLKNAVVLVKGSRGIQMEKTLPAL